MRIILFPESEDFLLFAAETDILSAYLNPIEKGSPIPPVRRLAGAVGIDYDFEDGEIFVSQITSKQIGRVKVNATTIENMTEVMNGKFFYKQSP